ERSVKLVDDVVGDDRMLALVTVRNNEPEVPGWDDLYEVGVAAVVHKLIRVPDGTLRILVQGVRRIRLVEPVRDEPYPVGRTEEKQRLLERVDVEERLREASRILSRELEVFELGTKIQSQVQSELEKGQREYFLRQQLKAIQEELGEGDEQQAEITELRERLEAIDLPEDTRKAAERELSRLEKLPSAAAE